MQVAQTLKTLKLFNIQRTCVHDGPGIRTTIFFQGCNLRCLWCQNPESQSFKQNMVLNREYSVDEIMDIILRDKPYYDSTRGGVTLSGGEPLLQDPENLISLLKALKKEKIQVSAESTLQAPWKNIEMVAPYIDLFLLDLKYVGNDERHKEYTSQDSVVIHKNIKKLIDLNANIKFRMVMVPGYTDTEENITNTAKYLKSVGYDSIELLKYYKFYEEKAKKFGIDPILLNITSEQALESLEAGLERFRELGIKAENTDLDSSKTNPKFTDRVLEIQEAIRGSKRGLSIESSRLKTKFYRKNGFGYPAHVHRAKRLAYVLENKKTIVYPGELLVGNFTPKRRGSQLWEDYHGTLGLLFLYNIDRQKPVSYQISLKDKIYTYLRIFPFWVKHSLLSKVYPKLTDLATGISKATDMKAGLNNNLLAIAHFVANYKPVLKLGTTGLIEKVRAKQKEHPENNQEFYEAAVIALKGLERFGQRYAEHLSELIKTEKDPERRKELEIMKQNCEHVPKHPARTFHEALQCVTLIHIALCQESYENAISFGRLDQILYPYYKKDLEEGRITYEEAKELICLFVLKMEELVLTTDGNSFISAYKAVETNSTDQALTFGGLGKDGKDATNDVTYMFLDACELNTYSIDMAARVNEDSPDDYLERIAEIYLNGCPIPQLFSDETYIDALMNHYPTTIENARDYSIVGCVEPTASDDHFGNTDCANMNLALALLQAIKGHDHDLWNLKLKDILLNISTTFFKWLFKGKSRISKFFTRLIDKVLIRRDIKQGLYKYNPPKSMDELLDRFQERLNVLGKSILTDHQNIERQLRTYFPTPLTSSFSEGCLESGKDVYEGGAQFNSSGIQAVGLTDAADSLYALNEVVFKKKLYTLQEVIYAIDGNFKGSKGKKIRDALLAVPKFGDDSPSEAVKWMNKTLEIYNNTLDSIPNVPRNGRYSAGYYALNVNTQYGLKTPALPSGRNAGVPLANSLTPHYGMEQKDLLSSLNSISKLDFTEHAENGTTVTMSIDSSIFQGPEGKKNLANIFKTFLANGGMMLQPNVIDRDILIEAYNDPSKHPYLLVRIAGYCAYFNELSDEMKRTIINRSCYSSVDNTNWLQEK